MDIAPPRFRSQTNLAPGSTAGDERVTGLAKIAKRLDERPALVQQALGSGAILCAWINGEPVTTASVIEIARRQIQAMREPTHLPGSPRGFASSLGRV